MNWIDLVLLLLVATSVISGLKQGFSRTGAGFLAVLAAFFIAAWVYPAEPARFLIVFVAIIIAGGIAAHLAGRWLRSLDLEWLDRPLGAAFGAVNGALVGTFLILALMLFGPKAPRQALAESHFAPYAMDAACAIAEAVPDEMRYGIRQSYEKLQKSIPPKYRHPLPPLPAHEI